MSKAPGEPVSPTCITGLSDNGCPYRPLAHFLVFVMSSDFAPPFFIARLSPSGEQCDAWADQSLLDSMEEGGLDWPSSCRNGTCRTCIGHLVSGSVHYAVEWPGLGVEEKAEGCVLPCVAIPESDVVLQPLTS